LDNYPPKLNEEFMKTSLTKNLLAAGLLLGTTTAMATPITINFNNTAGGSEVDHGINSTYTESGFNLTATGGTDLRSFDPTWEFGGPIGSASDGSIDGTDFMDFEINPGSASVTLSYTSPFSLLSFSGKDSWGGDPILGTLNLIGNIHGGGTATTSVVILANGAWDTYNLGNGWTNLDSVQFTGLPSVGTGTLMSLDNIVVSTGTGPTPSPVPVPATLWLLVSGFAGLAVQRSRKNRIA
jgi:hypothetical protein